jgi:hypothetical protein
VGVTYENQHFGGCWISNSRTDLYFNLNSPSIGKDSSKRIVRYPNSESVRIDRALVQGQCRRRHDSLRRPYLACGRGSILCFDQGAGGLQLCDNRLGRADYGVVLSRLTGVQPDSVSLEDLANGRRL